VCDELGRRLPFSAVLTALGMERNDLLTAHGRRPVPSGRRPDATEVVASAGKGVPDHVAMDALCEHVGRLCAAQPLLIVVDDLHWADEASLLLWSRLSRAAARLPLLLVGLSRRTPNRPELDVLRAELAGSDAGHELTLGPLGPSEVAALAEAVTGGRPGPRLERLLASAGGNPLYVREILDAAKRSGLLRLADHAADFDEGTDGAAALKLATDALGEIVTERLGTLFPESCFALHAAALHGTWFTAVDVADLAGGPPVRVLPLLQVALDDGLLEQVEGRLRFRHRVIRQILFEAVSEPLRVTIYREAARRLIRARDSPERAAEAVLRVLDATDGWEREVGNAGNLACRGPGSAIELIGQALADLSPAVEELDPRLPDHLAEGLFRLGRYERAEQMARSLLGDAGERRARALWIAGHCLARTGRLHEALELVTAEGVDSLTTSRVWDARLQVLRAAALAGLGRADEARSILARVLAGTEPLADAVATGYALYTLAREAAQKGDPAAGLSMLDRALAVADEDGRLDDLEILVHSERAGCLDALDRTDAAAQSLRRASTAAERVGASRLRLVQIRIAKHAFSHGDWNGALAELVAVEDPDGSAEVSGLFHAVHTLIALHRGDEAGAERHLRALDEVPGTQARPGVEALFLQARALAAERAGRRGAELEILKVLIDPRHTRRDPETLLALPGLVRAALADGEPALAHQARSLARESARIQPVPLPGVVDDWCRGVIEIDPSPLRSAARHFARSHRPHVRGAVLEDLAVVYAERSETQASRESLAEAITVYTELGARWDARRAAARLRAHGVRLGARGVRRRPSNGWDALTPTELKVAELAAAGLSNPDIAARLVLSRRTVQTHMSNILAKLGADSRREIVCHIERSARGDGTG
jgi:DNA-binding CsgD family transcriptional regulator